MNIIKRCNELIKEKLANWIGTSNQVAIKEVLDDRFKLQVRVDRLTIELEKKDKIIDLMARAIDNYDSQLEINTFKNKEHIKEVFEEKVGE